MVKNPLPNGGHTVNTGLIPGPGRSSGERNDNPLQYSRLENSMNRGALWSKVHGVIKELNMTE